MKRTRRISFLLTCISDQRKWIKKCGGNLTGYIEQYGDPGIPPLKNGEPKQIESVSQCDMFLFKGYQPVPNKPGSFFARHYGSGGSAIWNADYGKLLELEAEHRKLIS